MTPFAGIFIFNFPVPFFHHPAGTVQLHFFVLNLAKQTGPVFYTDGNEIQSGLRIMVLPQQLDVHCDQFHIFINSAFIYLLFE